MRAEDVDAAMAIAGALAHAPHWPRSAYETVTAADGLQPRVALVAEVAEGIAGIAVASVVAGTAELESIAVARSAQRHGLASALMATLIERVKAAGAGEMTLEVRASNRGAAAFYDRMGFLKVGIRPRYYRDPEEDAVILRLDLERAT
jgi:ribosomal-protein-alanine N-acetyltransferase